MSCADEHTVSSVQWAKTKSTASNNGREAPDIDLLELWRTVVVEMVVVTTGLMLAETDEVAVMYALLVIPVIQLW